jgi:hypothetical protein
VRGVRGEYWPVSRRRPLVPAAANSGAASPRGASRCAVRFASCVGAHRSSYAIWAFWLGRLPAATGDRATRRQREMSDDNWAASGSRKTTCERYVAQMATDAEIKSELAGTTGRDISAALVRAVGSLTDWPVDAFAVDLQDTANQWVVWLRGQSVGILTAKGDFENPKIAGSVRPLHAHGDRGRRNDRRVWKCL